MTGTTFTKLFLFVWVCAAAYALSTLRLHWRVRQLQAEGRAAGAPDIFNILDAVRGLVWLLTGRYATLDDEIATRWAGIARILFVLVVPMILALVAITATQAGTWAQPT